MSTLTPRQEVIQRLGTLKSERASWFAHWKDITTFLLPRNGRYFIQDRNKGYKRNTNIYDNTSTQALNILAAGLMGGLTSPARPWFRLGVSDQALMKNSDVKVWLDQSTRVMLDIFQKSNTYRVLHAMYKELGAFGTAAAIVTEDFDNVIHLTPLTAGEYCIATNWKGDVCTLYREFEKTVGEIVKEFGKENCSDRVVRMFDNNQLDQWIGVVHAIEPRADRDPSKFDNLNMEWKSVYYELDSEGDTCLRESGFRTFKVLAPRWDVAGGDIYGNGPGMEALGDIRQLQQEQLRKSQGIDYMTNPPLQVPTFLKNRDIDRGPGGITFRDSAAGTDKIETLFNVNLNLQHLGEDIQDVRARIRGSFFADMFLMLQNDTAGGTMTATEVAELREEKMLMIGPVLERLTNEMIKPLVDITFDMMMDAGIVPPPPPELQGQHLSIELISLLAQAQKAMSTQSVDRFVAAMGGIAQFKPEVLDNFSPDNWAAIYSDMLGVDPEILLPSQAVDALRQQRAQAQQAQAQQAAIAQQVDAAQKLGNTPTQAGGSNALDDVTQALTGYT
jgi:Bacteriophage head to tail connecting protein